MYRINKPKHIPSHHWLFTQEFSNFIFLVVMMFSIIILAHVYIQTSVAQADLHLPLM